MVRRKNIYYFGEKNCRTPIDRSESFISLPKKAFEVYATNFLLLLASFIFIGIAKRFETFDSFLTSTNSQEIIFYKYN